MHCPSCKNPTTLLPIDLDIGLPARKCNQCNGILVDLLSYRAWRDRREEPEATSSSMFEAKDNSTTLICPKCSRLMLKFKIGNGTQNTIDVCSHCDDAWLDEGEWELLGSLALQSKLTHIFTDPWQRRIKAEQVVRAQAERALALLGAETMARIDELETWIENHPKRDELLRILRSKLC